MAWEVWSSDMMNKTFGFLAARLEKLTIASKRRNDVRMRRNEYVVTRVISFADRR